MAANHIAYLVKFELDSVNTVLFIISSYGFEPDKNNGPQLPGRLS